MDQFSFDFDSIEAVRRFWDDLVADLWQDRREAEKLAAVLAPGHEPASGFVAADQNGSGDALLNAITRMRAFAESYLRNLERSAQVYEAREASVRQAFRAEEAMA